MIAQLGGIRNTFFMSSFDIGGNDYGQTSNQHNLLTDNDVDLLGGSGMGYPSGYMNPNNQSKDPFNDWGSQMVRQFVANKKLIIFSPGTTECK